MRQNPETEASHGDKGRVSLGFGELYGAAGDHIGHFYQNREEWESLLLSYLKTGLEAGEKCVYLMKPGQAREGLLEALQAEKIDVEGVIASGQLVFDEGRSHPAELKDLLRRTLAEIPGRFPLLRWGGDMTWSFAKLPTTEALMDWESHCNIVENPAAVFLCQYDLTKFRGNVVMDALMTHPLSVVSNVVHQNPYYETPEVFLEKLGSRDSTALGP